MNVKVPAALLDALEQILFNFRNRHFLALDLLTFCLTAFLALWMRIERFSQMGRYAEDLAAYVLIAIVLRLAVFIPMGVYSRYWRQASIDELAQIVLSVVSSTALIAIVFFGAMRPWALVRDDFPRSIPFLDGFLVLIVVGGTRYSVRMVERLQQRIRNLSLTGERVVVIGAGQAGMMIVREMQSNPQLGLIPVAFIDDDQHKHGTRIQGVPVVGSHSTLEMTIKDMKAQQVIIAMPTVPGKTIRELTGICKTLNVPVRTVPGMYEILGGSVTVNQLRSVDIEDLLRREPVNIDMASVVNLLYAKRVLVTGAGGSIGGELCRQIARCNPASLVLLGHGENSIFAIANELRQSYRHLNLHRVIADVRDADRVKMIFQRHRPQVVFHAAAHKHVSLMEENIEDAVTTNVLGTRTIVESAVASEVGYFVFISTDKAVNPTGIMGVTKRVAEMIVHDAAEQTGRRFASVRFGNVLGSSGSVVPLFKQQIARGGPVTITHPDARRYFMTIPEAVQLVLQAATIGKGGETFVLDMGEPVKIVDLARDLIRLSGLEEGRDIELVFTGLRPGEKLFEELFLSDETYARTSHSKVFTVRNGVTTAAHNGTNGKSTADKITQLIAAARIAEPSTVVRLLRELVPEYRVPVTMDNLDLQDSRTQSLA